jgi:hypothetical protein
MINRERKRRKEKRMGMWTLFCYQACGATLGFYGGMGFGFLVATFIITEQVNKGWFVLLSTCLSLAGGIALGSVFYERMITGA